MGSDLSSYVECYLYWLKPPKGCSWTRGEGRQATSGRAGSCRGATVGTLTKLDRVDAALIKESQRIYSEMPKQAGCAQACSKVTARLERASTTSQQFEGALADRLPGSANEKVRCNADVRVRVAELYRYRGEDQAVAIAGRVGRRRMVW